VSKLVTVIEQTTFLLGKQKESLGDCSAIFKDLLNTVEVKLNKTTDTKERETLEKVYDAISGQAQKMADYIQEDINFLTEQLTAFTNITKINDPKQSQEILDLMLGEAGELGETAEFKKTVTEEAVMSKQNLTMLVEDLKATILEGNAEEVGMFLESLLEDDADMNDDQDLDEDEEEEDEEDGCCDDEEDGCCDDDEEEELAPCICGKGENGKCTCKKTSTKETSKGCGGGCNGCSGGGCGSGCGTSSGSSKSFDLFELLNEPDTSTDKKSHTFEKASEKKTGCC